MVLTIGQVRLSLTSPTWKNHGQVRRTQLKIRSWLGYRRQPEPDITYPGIILREGFRRNTGDRRRKGYIKGNPKRDGGSGSRRASGEGSQRTQKISDQICEILQMDYGKWSVILQRKNLRP